jgi:hypothetical protein
MGLTVVAKYGEAQATHNAYTRIAAASPSGAKAR